MKTIEMRQYEALLRKELVPALGCTEPGAVGYAASKAADVLGILSGDPEDGLEIFKNATAKEIERTKELISAGFCKVHLQEGEGNLYINAEVFAGDEKASVIIKGTHTNIIYISKNDQVLFESKASEKKEDAHDFTTVAGIIEYADNEDPQILKDIIDMQITVNTAIAEEGLSSDYGANVGKTLIEAYGDDIKVRARAKAAAGSDARMGGSSLPVVINSGSGNQGITLTVPVVEYARELGVSDEVMYRSMAVSNLISIHIKKNIGKLSAFCGAVSAACGCGAAISYMQGGSYDEICNAITTTLDNVGGIICDGAKASCAAKIASSVDAAIMAYEMAKRGQGFRPGDGIVSDDIEETIKNFGIVGREGMKETDVTIMNLMIGC